jgi:hypothetical protein
VSGYVGSFLDGLAEEIVSSTRRSLVIFNLVWEHHFVVWRYIFFVFVGVKSHGDCLLVLLGFVVRKALALGS